MRDNFHLIRYFHLFLSLNRVWGLSSVVPDEINNAENIAFKWTHGSDVGNQHSIIGKTHASQNSEHMKFDLSKISYPGSRAETATWCDPNGNLWMFGGIGFDDLPSETPRFLHDLWVFNVTDQQWRLIESGSQQNLDSMVSVHKKFPSKRKRAAVCGVADLVFIIFGGTDANGILLADTWIYDIPISKWLPLSSRRRLHPSARYGMATWCLEDQMVIFGGHGKDAVLNDMWVFSFKSLKWSLLSERMSNPQINSQNLFLPAIEEPVPWIDKDHRLVLMSTGQLHFNETQDIWEFSLNNGTWSVQRSSRLNCLFGSKVNFSQLPVIEQQSATWILSVDSLLVFGGQSSGTSLDITPLFDLFMLDHNSTCWNYQIPRPRVNARHFSNRSIPSSRSGVAFWQHDGVFYLFGGIGYDGRGNIAYLNDMWVWNQSSPRLRFSNTRLRGLRVSVSAAKIFLLVLSAVGGIAFCFGSTFCLRRIDCRRHKRGRHRGINVNYSPLNSEAVFE